MRVKSAWFYRKFPSHITIVKQDGSTWIAPYLVPPRHLQDSDLTPIPHGIGAVLTEGKPDRNLASELYPITYAQYGLEKADLAGGIDLPGLTQEILDSEIDAIHNYCKAHPDASSKDIWAVIRTLEECRTGKPSNVEEPCWYNQLMTQEAIDSCLAEME